MSCRTCPMNRSSGCDEAVSKSQSTTLSIATRPTRLCWKAFYQRTTGTTITRMGVYRSSTDGFTTATRWEAPTIEGSGVRNGVIREQWSVHTLLHGMLPFPLTLMRSLHYSVKSSCMLTILSTKVYSLVSHHLWRDSLLRKQEERSGGFAS